MSERFEPESAAEPKELPAFAVRIELALTTVSGIILFGTMCMTVVDVLGRYFFSAPLGFAFEMTELMMAVTIFLAFSGVTLRGEHINVGLFDGLFVGRMAAFREAVISLFFVVAIGFICWRMFLFAGRLESYGDTTHVLKIHIYPFAYVGVFGLAMAALAAAVRLAVALRRLVLGTA